MKKMKCVMCVSLLLSVVLMLSSCTNTKGSAEAEKKKISITHMEGMKLVLEETKAVMEKKGYEIELILIDSNVNAIKSVNDASADAALAVHKGFMENFNAENKGDLVMVEPYTFSAGLGLYSEKHASLEEFPEGARIAIMNDSMNMSRGLIMLSNAGLIGLDPGKDSGFSLIDIVSNPKNIELIEMDQIQTVRTLEDLDGAIVFFGHMRNANKDWRTFIIRDADAADFPMAFVVKQENKDTQWAKDLAEAVRDESVRKVVLDNFDGIYEYFD